jgi:hypothetical protein
MSDGLSADSRLVLERERDAIVGRIEDLRCQRQSLEGLVAQVELDILASERLLLKVERMLGRAVLSAEGQPIELRGRRLREIAVEVLQSEVGVGEAIHYRDWLALLDRRGVRVGGKSPAATLLTQIANAPEVESVRRRSGLFRLKAA